MLRHLHLKNCFTHTDRRFDFERGLTCITGRNEAGKSLILEMVGYALFGNVALRASRPDGLYVDLGFQVKGVDYRVTRNGAKTVLLRDGAELATGIKPVNAAVIRVLGYDHTVFSMANLCSQGQIEALGAMKPAERKRAVDQTVGLSVLDDITKWCGDQALGFTREADTLERMLVEPVEPTPPDIARPVTADMIAAAEAAETERIEILAWLRNEPVVPPEPVKPCEEDATTLQALVNERTGLAVQVAALKTQADAIPDATMTEAEIAAIELAWAAHHRSEEKRKALAGLVEPTMDRLQCDLTLGIWDACDRWAQRRKLAERLTQCPNCGHEWADDAAWDRVKDAQEVDAPAVSRTRINAELRLIDAWEASADLRAKYADVPDAPKPSVSEAALRTARNALAEAERKAGLVREMTRIAERFVALPDRSADLRARQRCDAEAGAWAAAVARHAEWLKAKAVKDARLAELGETGAALALLRGDLQKQVIYEREVEAYRKARTAYEQTSAELKTARERAEH